MLVRRYLAQVPRAAWIALLLMPVQTRGLRHTVSKCFDAISQQSVKQKN